MRVFQWLLFVVSLLTVSAQTTEHFAFETEVNKLMKIIINSLYKSKEVFLRELISNASDALDKIRFISLTNPKALETAPELKITIAADAEKNTLTITDTGIGMTKALLKDNLGTIAKSGTAEFLKTLENKNDTNLIGQFGVGFYSAFLVADKVTVISKHNDDEQYVWESTAENDFTIAKDERGNTLGRGTQIILHLKSDAAEFLEPEHLSGLIRKNSEFINFPIYVWSRFAVPEEKEEKEESEASAEAASGEDGEVENVEEEKEPEEKAESTPKPPSYKFDWQLVNHNKPIWTRASSDVTEEEYKEFYRQVFKQMEDPLVWNHFRGEGEAEFKALLYIPSKAPKNFMNTLEIEDKEFFKLFIRRVFVTDDFTDFLPKWLRFMKFVVDSDDLVINVSRETLQKSPNMVLIRKKLIAKAIDTMVKLQDDAEKYKSFWTEYRMIIKNAIATDRRAAKKLIKLLRFESSANEFTSLDEYVSRMKKNQPQIYFVPGRTVDDAKNSPYAEKLIARGYEVLYFVDPLDEYLTHEALKTYEKFPLQHIGKSGLAFGDEKDVAEAEKELKAKFEPLTTWLQGKLVNYVSEVKLSTQLTKSPCAVLAAANGISPDQERLMLANGMSKDPMFGYYRSMKRVFEINPAHPVILGLLEKVNAQELADIDTVPYVLFESTAITTGWDPRDPVKYANQMDTLLRVLLGVDRESEAKVDVEPAPEKDGEETVKESTDGEETEEEVHEEL